MGEVFVLFYHEHAACDCDGQGQQGWGQIDDLRNCWLLSRIAQKKEVNCKRVTEIHTVEYY